MGADKIKIQRENAEDQVDLLFDEYDIDLDDPDLNAEDEDGDSMADMLRIQRNKLVKAVMKGRLEIVDTDGKLIVKQILKRPLDDLSTIHYRAVTGKAKIAMKSVKSTDNFGKMYAFLGSLSGEGMATFTKLNAVDLSVAESLAAVFFMV